MFWRGVSEVQSNLRSAPSPVMHAKARIQQGFALIMAWFEKVFIVGVGVHGLTNTAKTTGEVLRRLQTGLVQFYALIFVLGAVFLFLTLVKNL